MNSCFYFCQLDFTGTKSQHKTKTAAVGIRLYSHWVQQCAACGVPRLSGGHVDITQLRMFISRVQYAGGPTELSGHWDVGPSIKVSNVPSLLFFYVVISEQQLNFGQTSFALVLTLQRACYCYACCIRPLSLKQQPISFQIK